MSTNRIVFSLGDGFDSITGAHKGRGIISFKGETPDSMQSSAKDENAGNERKSFNRPRAWVQVASGDTQYDITLITNYQDLYQALDLKTSLSASTISGSGSSEIALFKKAKLSKQTVSLLIKGSKIGYIHVMPPDSFIDKAHIETLEQRPATFVESHGNEYISQVMYGKKIYALINFENTNQDEVLNIKQSLEAKLANDVEASIKNLYDKQSTIKHMISDINIEFTGVDLGLPSMGSNINDLLDFINQFNKAPLIDAPIGFVSEPYATILPIRGASELSKQIAMIHPLLLKYEHLYNRIRTVIPTIEKITSGIRYFKLDDEPCEKKAKHIYDLLTLANEYKTTLEDLILEINLNKIDLSTIPEKLSKKVTLDIPKSSMPLIDKSETDDQMSAAFHKKQFYIYDQLNTIVQLYTTVITELEANINNISQQFVAEIARIKKADGYFDLNLPPSGATTHWEIINKNENKLLTDVTSFNLAKMTSYYSIFYSHTPIYKDIHNGMDIKIMVQPNDHLKIVANGDGDFEVVASIVGLQALDSNIARHTTGWIAKVLSNVKNKNQEKLPKAIEFYGKTNDPLTILTNEEKIAEDEKIIDKQQYKIK